MSPELQFPAATGGDAAAVTALVRAAYAMYVDRIGREPAPMTADYEAAIARGQVLLALEDERLIGILATVLHADHLLIENIAVDPTGQGRGVGATLIQRAEQQARALGLRELRLYTNARMTENLDYYPRHGFTETGRRTEDGFDRVYFTKTLT